MTNYTYSISVEDKRKGFQREIFFRTIAEAADKLAELHQSARDDGYGNADYALTLKAV
jgi:hypothetical protein